MFTAQIADQPVHLPPREPKQRVVVSQGGPVSYDEAENFDVQAAPTLARGESITVERGIYLKTAPGVGAQVIVLTAEEE